MKRSLAPPKRENKLHLVSKNSDFSVDTRMKTTSNEKNNSSHVHPNYLKHSKESVNKFDSLYRNKNIQSLPTGLLVTLSGLNTLDISYNKLNDSQIELVMNSCTQLTTLCIQGNIYSLIPAAIWKLKELLNFRHDWLRICNDKNDAYEPEDRLHKIKNMVQKPEIVQKINKVVGMNFEIYCSHICHIPLDHPLEKKVETSDLSSFSKESILKSIKLQESSKHKIKEKSRPILEKEEIFGACTNLCGLDLGKEFERKRIMPKESISGSHKDFSEAETDSGSHKIKIEDIKDLYSMSTSNVSERLPEREVSYSSPGFPLHELFGNFNSSPKTPSEIDGLLLKGYNPNQYNPKGLSPYHVCIIENQNKGFEYLLSISKKNPGFFDLEMMSQKDGRNILHYCVFMKNYNFARQLIEFGLPVNRRDMSGSRIVHLVDQNYEFLLLLRKLIKKSTISIGCHIQNAISKTYIRHPQRNQEESKLRITYSKNDKLLEMFEEAVGTHKNQRI